MFYFISNLIFLERRVYILFFKTGYPSYCWCRSAINGEITNINQSYCTYRSRDKSPMNAGGESFRVSNVYNITCIIEIFILFYISKS